MDDRPVRKRHLRPQRRAIAMAMVPRPPAGQKAVGLYTLAVMNGPHLMLAHIGHQMESSPAIWQIFPITWCGFSTVSSSAGL